MVKKRTDRFNRLPGFAPKLGCAVAQDVEPSRRKSGIPEISPKPSVERATADPMWPRPSLPEADELATPGRTNLGSG